MGGFIVEDETGARQSLEVERLVRLFRRQTPPWPRVDDAEFEDRSKADGFVKLLALVQILWLVTQVIGRAVQGLATTTLELFTLGVVLWAIMIYAVLWKKPFDIQRPTVVYVQGAMKLDDRDPYDQRVEFTDHFKIKREDMIWCVCVCAIVSLGFSALHVVAWKFHFSTSMEMWFWRVASIVCTVTPLLLSALFLWRGLGTSEGELDLENLCSIMLAALYVIGRLYMFVEMFISLRAVPASVYETPQWSQYFPSFA